MSNERRRANAHAADELRSPVEDVVLEAHLRMKRPEVIRSGLRICERASMHWRSEAVESFLEPPRADRNPSLGYKIAFLDGFISKIDLENVRVNEPESTTGSKPP